LVTGAFGIQNIIGAYFLRLLNKEITNHNPAIMTGIKAIMINDLAGCQGP
jgi:hypothetical protein